MLTIYVMACDGFTKIGVTSRDGKSRRTALQDGCPLELRLVFEEVVDDHVARRAEQTVLHRLRDKRTRGEWLTATTDEVIEAINATLSDPTDTMAAEAARDLADLVRAVYGRDDEMAAFARDAGVHPRTVQRWLSGSTRIPTLIVEGLRAMAVAVPEIKW